MSQTLKAAIKVLNSHASSLDVPYPHWVGGDDVDQGASYCRACADAKVEAGEAEYVDGGWHQENDGCCHCDTCGRLLDYSLTDYGAAEELAHYMATPPTGQVSPEDAYHIAQLFYHDETNTEAADIVLKAARLIDSAKPLNATKQGGEDE